MSSFFKLISLAVQYGPTIAAFLEFLAQKKTIEARHQAATDFERGFRVFTETKDPTHLEDAIRAHCGRDGCLLP